VTDYMHLLLIAMPILTYIGLMISITFNKLSNVFLFVVVTIATIVLGLISISVIRPVGESILTTIIAGAYIGAMIYGGIGAKTKNTERLAVGLVIVILISFVSAYV